MESRPVQGQARFRLDRGFPGGGGKSSLRNGQEQAKQEKQQSSEHGTFSHHAAAWGTWHHGSRDFLGQEGPYKV